MDRIYLICTLVLLAAFHSNAYACVKPGVNHCSIKEATKAYKGDYGSATVKAYPANNQSTISLRKTLLIVPGYDPANDLRLDNIYADIDKAGLASNLRRDGYDVVIFKPNDSNAYIQRNAFTLVDLIASLSESSTNEITVLGLSLGGVTAKYALLYMRSQGMVNNVTSYISYDAPHGGAHIPLGMQAIPTFLVESTSNYERHLKNAKFLGVKVKDIAKVFDKLDTQQIREFLKEGEAAAAMVSQQFIQSPVAKQLLKQHHFLSEYAKAQVRVNSELARVDKPVHLGKGEYIYPPKPCKPRRKINLGRGDYTYTEVRFVCTELERRKIPWGSHYCESVHNFVKNGLVKREYVIKEGWVDNFTPSVCRNVLSAYKNRDLWQVELRKIQMLKDQLDAEMEEMGMHPNHIHSVAITNGSLVGRRLAIQPNQAYIAYTSREYQGASFNIHAYAEADGATYFGANLRALNADRYKYGFLARGSKYYNFGTTLLKSTDKREFLDNAAGGYFGIPQMFSQVFNRLIGAEFGNITPRTAFHSFIPTCSALAISSSVDRCRFSSAVHAAQISPFDKVYSVSNSSSKHLLINGYITNAIINEIKMMSR